MCITGFGKEKELPPVLFSFHYKNLYYVSVWTIDSHGNIYCFHDDCSLEMEDYEERKQRKNCKYVRTINENTLKEKYEIFHKVLLDKHYEKDMTGIREIITADFRGIQNWYGYSYNWKGEEKHTLMHGVGDKLYLSEDIRMKELADWAMELIKKDIWDYNKYCEELKIEENTQEYLRQKQNGELP